MLRWLQLLLIAGCQQREAAFGWPFSLRLTGSKGTLDSYMNALITDHRLLYLLVEEVGS